MSTPTRLLVTSIVRHARHDQKSGFARVVELPAGRVLLKALVPESAFRTSDPNPRGGLRGARGVSVAGDRLLIANAERVLLFDRSWKRAGELSHPLVGGIHDVLADTSGVWIASTSADLLVKLDWNGQVTAEWEWRKNAALTRALGFRRLPPVNRQLDFRDPQVAREGVPNVVHLNSVSPSPTGLLVSLGRILSPAAYRRAWAGGRLGRIARSLGLPRVDRHPGRAQPAPLVNSIPGSSSAIVSVHDDGQADVLVRVPQTTVPNHNAVRVGNTLLYNDSNGGRLVAVPLDGMGAERSVAIPGAPAFPRGLCLLNARRAVVGGSAPVAIYEVDLDDMRVVSAIPLGGEPTESVHALCLVPDAFADPPAALDGTTV